MKRRPTRADVAFKAGVSKTTVTYVLADRLDIAIPQSTRERVRSVAEQLGYQPHPAAKALASGRTNAVTVAFPIRIGAHYAHLLQAFERHTNTHGYHMVASTIGHVDIKNVAPDFDSLLNSLTDGVIVVDPPAAFQEYIEDLLPAAKPVVSVGVFTLPSTDCVQVNLEKGSADALDHLLSSNPKRLALFGPGIADESSVLDSFAAKGDLDPRIFAYCKAMHQAGRPVEMIAGQPNSRGASMQALRDYIAQSGCPDAIFCFNDEIAIGANRALRELGIRVPEDVLLVGCDGTEEGDYMTPALSTIAQPIDQMCAIAWDFMTRRLAQPGLPRQKTTVYAEFVDRGSSSRRPVKKIF
jgi:LacI family transcriptional regulator